MEDILEMASRLGKRIADDDRVRALNKARQALDADLTARQTLADYEQTQRSIGEREAVGKPIEPADKRKLAKLHAEVIGNDTLKELLKRQADFLELMTLVSQRIEADAIGPADQNDSD